MAASKPRVKVPKAASAGEIITIKTLISHEMETGQRKDKSGNLVPRRIINKFTCEFDGAMVFECDLEPAVAANPYLEFNAKVAQSGSFKFSWVDDDGSVYTQEEAIEVK